MLMPSAKDPTAARQFTLMAAMQLLRRLSRADPGLQGWLQLGLAHCFEYRCAGGAARTSPAATLPPDAESPGDRDAFVGDVITAGKALLGALRSGFDLDLVAAVDEWKAAVK